MLSEPVRLVPFAFAAVIAAGTGVLCLPVSRAPGAELDPLAAAFTAVSATCVTGLSVVDTATYWSPFGQAVILTLIQVGGLGVMSLATFLTLTLFGRLNVHGTLVAQTEGHISAMGNVARSLRTIVLSVLFIETLAACALALRFAVGHHMPWPKALWYGVFHAISAFNNAGFALFSDNLMGLVDDPVIIPVICLAITAGGLGFPVYYELIHQRPRLSKLSMHARLTLAGYFTLTLLSALSFAQAEWRNPGTIGGLHLQGKLLGVMMGAVTPRTAGFNSIDYSQVREETLLIDSILMFIGGGSAGTAGGIKVTTFLVLAWAIWTQLRGEHQVVVGNRAVPRDTIREALTVALLSVALVVGATLYLLAIDDHPLGVVLFEASSAFGTTGLSTGITASFSDSGKWVLMALMFIGRIGPMTAATALAMRRRHRHYRLAEERPIIG